MRTETTNNLSGNDRVIDFEKQNNEDVRLYVGDGQKDYEGEGWDEPNYHLNAGRVRREYIAGYADVSFPGCLVLEACDTGILCDRNDVTKNDMKAGKVPCFVVIPKRLVLHDSGYGFYEYMGLDGVVKVHFWDTLNDILSIEGAVLSALS